MAPPATVEVTIKPEINVSATNPPISPPFKRNKLDLIKRSKSNDEVVLSEATFNAVNGQKGFNKNMANFCLNLVVF